MPKKVSIVEVGPRDGLQNEKTIVSLDDKVTYIKMLAASGLKDIEATSFVRASKIPQMSDGGELYKKLLSEDSLKGVRLYSLVPNDIGIENALSAGVKEIAIFTSTSNAFNLKNINATIDESLVRIDSVMKIANSNGLKVRAYVSTVFGCPYEGKTSLSELKRVAIHLKNLGVAEISLGDTIGVAHPVQVKEVIDSLSNDFKLDFLAMHFHDTRGMAIANTFSALEMGITRFDSSSAGLGGCPYASGASGNVATEDLVTLFTSMGIDCGVNLQKLSEASIFILKKLNKTTQSKSLTAFLAKDH